MRLLSVALVTANWLHARLDDSELPAQNFSNLLCKSVTEKTVTVLWALIPKCSIYLIALSWAQYSDILDLPSIPSLPFKSCGGAWRDNTVHGMKQVLIGWQALWSSLWGAPLIINRQAASKSQLPLQQQPWKRRSTDTVHPKLSVVTEREFIQQKDSQWK